MTRLNQRRIKRWLAAPVSTWFVLALLAAGVLSWFGTKGFQAWQKERQAERLYAACLQREAQIAQEWGEAQQAERKLSAGQSLSLEEKEVHEHFFGGPGKLTEEEKQLIQNTRKLGSVPSFSVKRSPQNDDWWETSGIGPVLGQCKQISD